MKELNKKANWALILSVASLVIIVAIIGLWCFKSKEIAVVTLDTYVGVIVALLAIIVTIVLGWQIFNIFELRQKMEEMNELKSQFNEQSEKIKKLSLRVEHFMNLTWGDNEMSNKNYGLATYYYIKSLNHALAMDFTVNIPKIKSALKSCKDEMNKTKKKRKISPLIMAKIECVNKEIRGYAAYCCMKDFYDDIYENFIEHTIVDDDQK